jgi:hypothetical protein
VIIITSPDPVLLAMATSGTGGIPLILNKVDVEASDVSVEIHIRRRFEIKMKERAAAAFEVADAAGE